MGLDFGHIVLGDTIQLTTLPNSLPFSLGPGRGEYAGPGLDFSKMSPKAIALARPA